MLIHLSPNNPKPMYEQIVHEIQRLIVSRHMEAGEMLPSIRELSKELTTSAITVRRAYHDLESSGFIYTRAGKGSFVADLNEADLLEWKRKQVEEPLQEAIRQAQMLGLPESEALQLFSALWSKRNL